MGRRVMVLGLLFLLLGALFPVAARSAVQTAIPAPDAGVEPPSPVAIAERAGSGESASAPAEVYGPPAPAAPAQPPAEPALPAGVSPDWWAAVQADLAAEGALPRAIPGTTPDWTATGEEMGALFGISVTGVGDVNGDGYADLLVGARGYNSYQGKVYLYLGAATGLSLTAAWTATGEFTDTYFGMSVAGAGDVDGDGYADILVGAPYYNSQQGRTYLYLGSPTGPSPTADWIVTGENVSDRCGSSVAGVGDVNGDGYADILVGAHGYNGFQGKAYLYLGSATGPSPIADWTATGEGVGDVFAGPVAGAGDVNGDGYTDLLVGAFAYNSYQGKAYLYLGSPGGLSLTAAWTATGEFTDTNFGISAAGVGDVNGDGYADLLVGAYQYNGYQGKTYLYLGAATGPSLAADWTATGEFAGTYFGTSVAGDGDVNGDGYADILVGAPYYNSQQGRAYLYLGSPTGPSPTADWTATGEFTNTYFGVSAVVGDVNDDGYADVVIGAPLHSTDRGKAYLYLGAPATPTATAGWMATGENMGDQFAWSVAAAGDVNGDGYTDIIAGSLFYNTRTGKAYLYRGSAAGPSLTPDWTATGEGAGSDFGVSVAGAGDVNGDGYADVIVGSPGTFDVAGKAYLYLGSPAGPSPTPDWAVTGTVGDQFGTSVAGAGDVNGDGYADVVIGAPYSGFTQAYLYLGSPGGLSSTPAWTATGSVGDQFGISVAGAGDVNGDGYDDLVFGASAYNGYQGKTYLYLGSATGPSLEADWSATGEALNDYFGTSIARVGDINGDGYADVVIGAQGYNGYQGKAYLYLGSATGLASSPAWTATGEAAGNHFGMSVAGAGDVNGDGYTEVLVGATLYGTIGKAYLYMGSPGGPSSAPDWIGNCETVQDFYGYAVATAGDANGDGYADILVGAYGAAGSNGRVYLYEGNGRRGVVLTPGQWRADGSAPLAPLGISDSNTAVQLRLTGRSPAGRDFVRLQWQVAPLGTPFTATGVISGTGITWTDTLTGGVLLTETVGGLAPGLPYHWRVRLLYYPNSPTGQVAGRWLTLPPGGGQEKLFRTAEGPITGFSAAGDPVSALGYATHLTATADLVYLRYDWSFGDGQFGVGPAVTHTYDAVGVYTAVVTASNSLGALTTTVPVVVEELIAGLSAANNGPTVLGQSTLFFAAVLSGTSVTYAWNLGDGTAGSGAVLTHTYTATGSYTVLVTATNPVNVATATTTVLITTETPIVGLTATSDSPIVEGWFSHLSAQVVAGTSVSYTWDLGDGTSAAGAQVTHLYPGAGIYRAVVTATNPVSRLTATAVISVATAMPLTPAQGGTLFFTDTQGLTTTIEVPAGAVTRTALLAYFPLLTPTQPLTPGVSFARHAFILEVYADYAGYAVYLPDVVVSRGAPGLRTAGMSAAPTFTPTPPKAIGVTEFGFAQPVTITVYYSDADVSGLDESTLRIVYWDGSGWSDAAESCAPASPYIRDLDRNILIVAICHLTEFEMIGN